jgi:signal transduction histidine kinase
LSKSSKLWLVALGGMMGAFILAAVILPRSISLTALSDVVQTLLLLSGAASFMPLAWRSTGRMRLFWTLITLGLTFWLAYQLFWTYHEVLLQRDVPDLCAWDIVLFLHLVPLMAALALRPHIPRDEYSARVRRLDFALLLVWWCYLYVLIVMPWQYVVPDIAAYNRDLNNVYTAEKLVLLAALMACWGTSKGEWKKLFAALFAATLAYSAGSTFANWAIAKGTYYSGSLYDIPMVAGMASFTWIGLSTKASKPESGASETSSIYGVWVARLSMIAVFSLALFAAWAMSDNEVPSKIRVYRLALTLLAAFGMGVMILVRQRMLDRELVQLLGQSREAFENLKRLQAQLLQSEKLASIGQLVGGVAHELNNPITAMLGYSDLLLSTKLSEHQRPHAVKIGQYVRRTKSLVASLISFARQTPVVKTQLDLNTLARTAVKLIESQWQAQEIEIHTEFDAGSPKVIGDSNQLLQVCVQLVGNCLHVLNERNGRTLSICTKRLGGSCVLEITTEIDRNRPQASGVVEGEDTLGLSACLGIVQEHQGQISREDRDDGSLTLRVELPTALTAPSAAKPSTVPVLWQSQPYA